MTSRKSSSRRFVLLTALAGLTLALSACGRKSALKPPEEAAELYTYPSRYPARKTVEPLDPDEELEPSFLQPLGGSRSTTTTTGPKTP